MPVAKFVELYGLEHYDISMRAIYEITKFEPVVDFEFC